jgi:putative hydrolase of the HAD superfamily
MIDTIISDLGNVLLRFDNAIFFRAMTRFTAKPVEEIRGITHDNVDLLTLFEKGAVSEMDFYVNAKDLLESTASFEEFFTVYGDVFALNQPVLELYRRLRPGFKMALLSSTDIMRWTFIKRRFPEILIFDHYVLSFDMGVMKPDPLVYREALNLTGSGPGTAVFIDDLPENVAGAERMGIQGIVFSSAAELETDLARLGVTPPPRPS